MKLNVFWFRRDLRVADNHGLFQALVDESEFPVLPLFIFDRNILDNLPHSDDARVSFIHDAIHSLNRAMEQVGSSLHCYYGHPAEIWEILLSKYSIQTVFTNEDYEPYAIKRDAKIAGILSKKGVELRAFKDHLIFAKKEIIKDDGLPYTVFTPYKRKWLKALNLEEGVKHSEHFKSFPSEKHLHKVMTGKGPEIPSLQQMGFTRTSIPLPDKEVKQQIIKEYDRKRNFPAIIGTSRLGIHFRFGTISIREKARKAFHLNQTFLSELIWRDFYAQILYNFPHVAEGPFRPKYANIDWLNNEASFERWKNGTTGYSLVDAGMRELKQTGFMHNRVRMLTASFLTKHLLIDWRWGEQHFADHLLDFDLASNNGGWQWAAGSGTDAAPYFRIFNPMTQQEKFDKQYIYVKQYVSEFGTDQYPEPIVDHKAARQRCLDTYKEALS